MCVFVLGFVTSVCFLGFVITSLWALMEVAQLGNSVLLPSEQGDQTPVFLVLLSHLVVVDRQPHSSSGPAASWTSPSVAWPSERHRL